MKQLEQELTELIARKDYVPLNVPELLEQLRVPPNRQQDLQRVLRELEQSGGIARTKGNRWTRD